MWTCCATSLRAESRALTLLHTEARQRVSSCMVSQAALSYTCAESAAQAAAVALREPLEDLRDRGVEQRVHRVVVVLVAGDHRGARLVAELADRRLDPEGQVEVDVGAEPEQDVLDRDAAGEGRARVGGAPGLAVLG